MASRHPLPPQGTAPARLLQEKYDDKEAIARNAKDFGHEPLRHRRKNLTTIGQPDQLRSIFSCSPANTYWRPAHSIGQEHRSAQAVRQHLNDNLGAKSAVLRVLNTPDVLVSKEVTICTAILSNKKASGKSPEAINRYYLSRSSIRSQNNLISVRQFENLAQISKTISSVISSSVHFSARERINSQPSKCDFLKSLSDSFSINVIGLLHSLLLSPNASTHPPSKITHIRRVLIVVLVLLLATRSQGLPWSTPGTPLGIDQESAGCSTKCGAPL